MLSILVRIKTNSHLTTMTVQLTFVACYTTNIRVQRFWIHH